MWGQIIGAVAGSLISGNASKKAASQQAEAAQYAAELQAQQVEKARALLNPYVQGGNAAQNQYLQQLGLARGEDGQYTKAIGADGKPIDPYSQFAESDNYKQLLDYGNRNILAQAGATGGLRGGNTQALLAQSAPSLLSQLYQQRLANLSPLISVGQNAASNSANIGQNGANNIGSLAVNQGNNEAGYSLLQGKQYGSLISGLGSNTAFTNKIDDWLKPNPIGTGKGQYNPPIDAFG